MSLLIDRYALQLHKKPNYVHIKDASTADITIEYRWLNVASTDPSIFSPLTPGELRNLFDEQTKQMEKELQVLIKYWLIAKSEANRTQIQYQELYFQDWFAFKKEPLLKQSTNDQKSNTVIERHTPHNSQTQQQIPDSPTLQSKISQDKIKEKTQDHTKKFSLPDDDILDNDDTFEDEVYRPLPNSNIIGISTQAIRNITKYSYVIQQPWHTTPQIITWQKELIDAPENLIIVDWSRQWGKSLTLAEKLIEESFIPGKDLMVAAFLQETTESIWEYLLTFIENFDQDTFTYKERKRYIQNNESWVRIHFRTLKDWAKWIRWKTLRLIVVDEAMLVPTNVFKSILLPTQSTIENPKLILIGTASEDTSCYMYQELLEIKKSIKYNNPGQRTARYIKFSVLDNPLMSPIEFRRVMDDKDLPSTKREYFNVWWKLEDSLFQLRHISFTEIPNLFSNQAHILLAIDPARKQDRSAYTVLHCIDNKVISLESWEVPASHKDDWSLQALFFKQLLARFSKYQSQSIAIDATWVWDWVAHIFKDAWLPVQDTIRYTVWDTESSSNENTHTVWKSLLINNAIDMISENQVYAPYETNELLLEEVKFIQHNTTRTWKISFHSDFYDDITNALLIWLYTARKKRFINRSTINSYTATTFDDELKSYEPKHPRFVRNTVSSSW